MLPVLKKHWLRITLALIILAAIFWLLRSEISNLGLSPALTNTRQSPAPTAAANVSKTVSPTPTSSPRPSSSSSPRVKPGFSLPTPPPRQLLTGPASCAVAGTIRFLNPNLYQNEGAKISYQNVDDYTRFIYWKIFPDDGTLKVGPNIFAELDLPNGERDIGVTLYPPAAAKQYALTASVTYGVINQTGAEEIKEAPCAGSVKVIMP